MRNASDNGYSFDDCGFLRGDGFGCGHNNRPYNKYQLNNHTNGRSSHLGDGSGFGSGIGEGNEEANGFGDIPYTGFRDGSTGGSIIGNGWGDGSGYGTGFEDGNGYDDR